MPESIDLRAQTVLVTGGHGFIGRHVVAALEEAGAYPVSTTHPESGQLPDLPGATITADLEDPDQAVEAVAGADMVVHLAARAGGIQFQRDGGAAVYATNRLITDNVLAAAIDAGVRRLFLASSLVTYRPASEPLTEEHPQLDAADDAEPYARSKIADEDAVSERTSLNSVIGRFGNVYGPGASLDSDRATVVHALIDRAAQLGDTEDLIVWGDGHATRSLVFVTDAAQGVLCCLTTGAPGEAYNIDSGQAVSIAELATLIRDEVNPSLNLVFDSSHPSGPQHRVGSIERLRALGYRPRINLPEGIARTVAWYRSQDRSGSRD